MLFVSFSAVSAMIFLVYLCSWLLRKRMTLPYFGRRLAASWAPEKCEESDSSSAESRAHTSSEETQNLQNADVQLFPGLTPVDELIADAQYAPSVEATAGAAAQFFLGATTEQVKADGMHAPLKRRGEEVFIRGDGEWAKKLILEVPLDEGPLQPAPPLDPELDAFIDAVLLGNEDPLGESTWLRADETETSEPLDVSAGSRPSTSAGASDLAQTGSIAWGAVHGQLSMPSHAAGDLWENHKEGSGQKQQLAAGPLPPQNILHGSAVDVAGHLVSSEASFAAAKVSF